MMNNSDKNIKIVSSALVSAALVSVFVAAITIFGELYAPLKGWLKVTFSHHWLGKSFLSAGLFVFLFIVLLFKKRDDGSLVRSMKAVFWLSATSSSTILIFYLYEVLLAH